MTGAVLLLAAGIAYLKHGWVYGQGLPILNGNLLGGVIISLSSLVSAQLLRTDLKDPVWPRFVSICLLAWALLWWFGTGTAEILDRAPHDTDLHLLLLFLSASFAVMALVAKRFRWVVLKRATLVFLPCLAFVFLAYLIEYKEFFGGLGAPAWIAAIAAHVWILYVYVGEKNRAEMVWHGWGVVFFAVVLAYEMYQQVDRVALNNVWPFCAAMLVLAASAVVFLFERRRARWPINDYFSAYYVASLTLIAGFLVLLVFASTESPGSPEPLPYIPILNPFDVLSIIGLAAAWYAIRIGQQDERLSLPHENTVPLTLWGGSAFVLSTLAVVRGAHHFADIPWHQQALQSSVVVQTSLTIFWAALGLSGMLLGTRRTNRRIWMLGVGLMVVVVLKLAVIDLGNTGTLARIVSFLGVGVMLLVVGYFSPVPPKADSATSGVSDRDA